LINIFWEDLSQAEELIQKNIFDLKIDYNWVLIFLNPFIIFVMNLSFLISYYESKVFSFLICSVLDFCLVKKINFGWEVTHVYPHANMQIRQDPKLAQFVLKNELNWVSVFENFSSHPPPLFLTPRKTVFASGKSTSESTNRSLLKEVCFGKHFPLAFTSVNRFRTLSL
jgi:hypothetical protein